MRDGTDDARVVSLAFDTVDAVKYEDTEHWAVTKAFLMNPQRVLDRTFADADAGEVREASAELTPRFSRK